ncbi:MAG: RHS repeat-associated core domain-containing protein, partial [Gammaproteobacteria bacterium]
MLDGLSRPSQLGPASALPTGGGLPPGVDPVARFTYQGPALPASRALGLGATPAVAGGFTFDAARRLTGTAYQDPSSRAVLEETLAWTPRGFPANHTREDLNVHGRSFGYDPAGRLAAVSVSATGFPGLPAAWSFEHDRADNLLSAGEEGLPGSGPVALPLDGSGRNRPSSVGGVPLAWDANGNLFQKGDLRFHYDFRNRLTRVTDGGGQEVVRYAYDALDRLATRTADGSVTETVWSGMQPIEDYVDGQLAVRRTYGLGLDDLVWVERDSDGDGALDAGYHPVYDAAGNLAMVVDAEGVPIESYAYSPFGRRWVRVNDRAPPAVEQVRVTGGAVWLELSEEVSLAEAEAAVAEGGLALVDTASGQPHGLAVSQPVREGRRAGHRLVLTPDPAPAAGSEVRLVLGAGALADVFGNPNDPTEHTFLWTDSVVTDTAPPRVAAVAVETGRLRVTFTEPPDPATAAAAIQVDGQADTWTPAADAYTLESAGTITGGEHTVTVTMALLDLAGTALAETFDLTFSLAGPDEVLYLAPDPDVLTASTVGNSVGFHGLPADAATGLIYARHRWYDPELARFTTVDPMGFRDSPNPYQYALNNPLAYSDPLGLCVDGRDENGEICGPTAEEMVTFSWEFFKGLLRHTKEAAQDVAYVAAHPGETASGVFGVVLDPSRLSDPLDAALRSTVKGLASPDPAEAADAASGLAFEGGTALLSGGTVPLVGKVARG